MDITLEKQNATDASIKVTLSEADYQPKVEEKLKEYGKKAQMKGFRPGKVPPSLIKKMYGKSVLIDEINHLLVDAVNKYIKESKLSIVGEPLPNTEDASEIDWDNQKQFEFSYNVGLVPEFTYDITSLDLTSYDVEVSDKDLQETVENLRKRLGNSTQPEDVQEGDFLTGKLEQKEGSFSKEKVFFSLDQVAKEALPQFVGAKKNDSITIDIQKAFTDPKTISTVTGLSDEEADSLKGECVFTIEEINRTEPASLDQEFFDKVVGKDTVESEEEFLNKLRELINENYQKEAERLVDLQMRTKLVDKTTIELPNDFLKKWLLTTNDKVTQEQIEKEFDLYVKELKWSLIKNKIAEDAGIKVEHEEVIEKTKALIKQQFGSLGLGEEAEENLTKFANNYLQAEKGKNYMNIFEQVFTDRILNHLKEQAPVTKKSISADEFKKLELNEI